MYGRKGGGVSDNPLTNEIMRLNAELCTSDDKEPVEELLERNRNEQKRQYDKGRREAPEYKSDDLVMIRSEAPATGKSRKLEPKYRGPYEIVKSLGRDRYLVQDIEGEQQSARIYKGIIAADRLKLIST